MIQIRYTKHFCLVVISIASIVNAGCVSAPPHIGNPETYADEKVEEFSNPALGMTNTADIGDNLYGEYRKLTRNTYDVILKDDASGLMDLGHTISISKGTRGTLQRHENKPNNKLMCFDLITKPGTLDKATLGGPAHACLVDTNDDGYFDSSMFKVRDRYFPLDKNAAYDLIPSTTKHIDSKDSFERAILYQGISKGTIKISYREFYEDTARPAFTQDVTYDLNDNGETLIAFKGLRIRVLNATNTNITYIVDRPFK